jgi:hypothetical protein
MCTFIWNLSSPCQISNEFFKKFHESQPLGQENVRPRFQCSSMFAERLSTLSVFLHLVRIFMHACDLKY